MGVAHGKRERLPRTEKLKIWRKSWRKGDRFSKIFRTRITIIEIRIDVGKIVGDMGKELS